MKEKAHHPPQTPSSPRKKAYEYDPAWAPSSFPSNPHTNEKSAKHPASAKIAKNSITKTPAQNERRKAVMLTEIPPTPVQVTPGGRKATEKKELQRQSSVKSNPEKEKVEKEAEKSPVEPTAAKTPPETASLPPPAAETPNHRRVPTAGEKKQVTSSTEKTPQSPFDSGEKKASSDKKSDRKSSVSSKSEKSRHSSSSHSHSHGHHSHHGHGHERKNSTSSTSSKKSDSPRVSNKTNSKSRTDSPSIKDKEGEITKLTSFF